MQNQRQEIIIIIIKIITNPKMSQNGLRISCAAMRNHIKSQRNSEM